MPVRCVIHSSVVSISVSRSLFVTILSGTAWPVPMIFVLGKSCSGLGVWHKVVNNDGECTVEDRLSTVHSPH
jgi:hypothetical protein